MLHPHGARSRRRHPFQRNRARRSTSRNLKRFPVMRMPTRKILAESQITAIVAAMVSPTERGISHGSAAPTDDAKEHDDGRGERKEGQPDDQGRPRSGDDRGDHHHGDDEEDDHGPRELAEVLLVLGGRAEGGVERAVEKEGEDEEQHEVGEGARGKPAPMEMPSRGPTSFITAALIATQIPYWTRLASAFPRIFPNRRSIGRTEDSMISTVLLVFSVRTDLPMTCP